MFTKNVGLDENYIKDNIVFFYNEKQLDYNSNEILKTKFKNGDNITVSNNHNNSKEMEDLFIYFNASSGIKKIIKVSNNITIEQLIKIYLGKIEIEKDANIKKLIFFFNELKIEPNSKEIISKVFNSENPIINVLDKNNIIKF